MAGWQHRLEHQRREEEQARKLAWEGVEPTRDPAEFDDLDKAVAFLETNALAATTRKTASYPLRRFEQYLDSQGITLGKGGISDEALRRYVAHISLDKGITSYDTVKVYMSYGPRYYHEIHDLRWRPIHERPRVATVLRGLRRMLQDAPSKQKQAVTVEMLYKMRDKINIGSSRDLCIFTAILVGFFGLLRKANLAHRTTGGEGATPGEPSSDKKAGPAGLQSREDAGVLTRTAVSRDARSGATLLTLTGTKTIQFGERKLKLVLPTMHGNPICPTAMLASYMRLTADRPATEALFGYWEPSPLPAGAKRGAPGTRGSTAVPPPAGRAQPATGLHARPWRWQRLTHRVLVARLKELLAAIGEDPAKFAGHSLRRGGATFAFAEAGLHEITIKALGDWVSEAFLRYCEVQEALRTKGAQAMAAAANAVRARMLRPAMPAPPTRG